MISLDAWKEQVQGMIQQEALLDDAIAQLLSDLQYTPKSVVDENYWGSGTHRTWYCKGDFEAAYLYLSKFGKRGLSTPCPDSLATMKYLSKSTERMRATLEIGLQARVWSGRRVDMKEEALMTDLLRQAEWKIKHQRCLKQQAELSVQITLLKEEIQLIQQRKEGDALREPVFESCTQTGAGMIAEIDKNEIVTTFSGSASEWQVPLYHAQEQASEKTHLRARKSYKAAQKKLKAELRMENEMNERLERAASLLEIQVHMEMQLDAEKTLAEQANELTEAIAPSYYPYEVLSKQTQFRLLRLMAGSPDDSLECALHVFDLLSPNCPKFEALSYEWNPFQGDPDWREQLICHDSRGGEAAKHEFEITLNLCDFLMHIRQPTEDLWVWVDALCIDQGSLEERGHQVRLMGQIYGRSERVLTWLPAMSAETCYMELEQLRKTICTQNELDFDEWAANVYQTMCYTAESESPGPWYILNMTYWTRKWIIQEVVLAPTVILIIGRCEFPLRDLEEMLVKLDGIRKILAAEPDANLLLDETVGSEAAHAIANVQALTVAKLVAHRRTRRIEGPYCHNLCDLLPRYTGNQCHDPLDHVYAFLELLGPHREHLTIDYSLAPHIWFLKVLKFLEDHEPVARRTMMNCAHLLLQMISCEKICDLQLSMAELRQQSTTTAFSRGVLVPDEETSHSLSLKKKVRGLNPGLHWTFSQKGPVWCLHKQYDADLAQVNPRTLSYFRIPDQDIHGLAAPRIQCGDRVWQFPNTDLAFIVRPKNSDSDDRQPQMEIAGRCYLFNGNSMRLTLPIDELSQYTDDKQLFDLQFTVGDLLALASSAGKIDHHDNPLPTSLTRKAVPPKEPDRNTCKQKATESVSGTPTDSENSFL